MASKTTSEALRPFEAAIAIFKISANMGQNGDRQRYRVVVISKIRVNL